MCKLCEEVPVLELEGMRMHLSGIRWHDFLWIVGNDVNLSEV